jgi:hypothetical protein
MAFVRQKGKYFVVVENYREGEKVKQKTVGYLGKAPTFENDFKFLKDRIKAHAKDAIAHRQTLYMLCEIVARNQKALERRVALRKAVSLSPELEREILKQERGAKRVLVAAKRALLKLTKVGAR